MGHLAGIGAIADTAFAIADNKSNWIRRIVGDPKGTNHKVVDLHQVTGIELLSRKKLSHFFLSGSKSADIRIGGDSTFPGNYSCAADVVIMFMCKTQCLDITQLSANGLQTRSNFLTGKPSIDQYTGLATFNKNCIPAAAAAKN